jgi:hypothetical protein
VNNPTIAITEHPITAPMPIPTCAPVVSPPDLLESVFDAAVVTAEGGKVGTIDGGNETVVGMINGDDKVFEDAADEVWANDDVEDERPGVEDDASTVFDGINVCDDRIEVEDTFGTFGDSAVRLKKREVTDSTDVSPFSE